MNYSLLAYLTDGKNCQIAVLDESGKIRARAILRILLDKQSNQPVLFLEKFYPEVITEIEIKAITTMAIKKAEAMNLLLLTMPLKSDDNGTEVSLVSLGGRADSEYVDANTLGLTNAIFTIEGNKKVFMHQNTNKSLFSCILGKNSKKDLFYSNNVDCLM